MQFIVKPHKGNTQDFNHLLSFGDIIALKSSDEKFMGVFDPRKISVDSDYIGKEQEFLVERSGNSADMPRISFGDCISLKTRDGKYLQIDEKGELFAENENLSDNARFILWRSGDSKNISFVSGNDTISLQSYTSKKFINSETVQVQSEQIESPERWKLIISEKILPKPAF